MKDLLNRLYGIQKELMRMVSSASVPHNMEEEEAEDIRKAIGHVVAAQLILTPHYEARKKGTNAT